jgi:exopolyphosphatase/guanosine-5'-triphosphate,3'-diphosphate pyrophosphatase
VTSSITLPIGCVSLTEKFLRHDPPSIEELSTLREHVLAELKFVSLRPGPGDFVRGIGGAITSVAAVSLGLPQYVSRRVEGYILGKEEMERCAETLSALGLEEREHVAGLGRKRAQIAVAGAVLLLLLAERLELPNIFVSTRGLRYGLALEAARARRNPK